MWRRGLKRTQAQLDKPEGKGAEGPDVGHTLPRVTGGSEAQGLVGKSIGSGALWPKFKSGSAPGWVIATAACMCLSSAALHARGAATRMNAVGQAVLREHLSPPGATAGIREAPLSPANTKKRSEDKVAGCRVLMPLSLSLSPSSQTPPSLTPVYSGERVQSSFSLQCKGMLQHA